MTTPTHKRTNPRTAARIGRVLIFGCAFYTIAVLLVIAVIMNAPSLYARLNAESYAQLHSTAREHAIALVVLLAIAFYLKRRATLRPAIAKTLLPLSFLFILASADRLIGVAYPPPLRQNTVFGPHDVRGWTNIPNGHASMEVEILLDEHGLRVDELDPTHHRTNGRIRIMFLGDSVTFGFYQRARDTYGARATAILNEANPDLDVVGLNAGMTGYDTWQEWHYFENEGVLLAPDALVLQFCLNDAAAMYDPRIGPDMDRHPQASQIAQPMHWSGIHRALAAWAAKRKFGENLQKGAEALQHFQMEELLQPELEPVAKHALELVEKNLERIASCCRRHNIPFVIVCFPMRTQLTDEHLVPHPQRVLAAFCKKNEIPYLDLLPAFRKGLSEIDGNIDSLFIDHVHPTRAGNTIAGKAAADFLLQSGVIDELHHRKETAGTTTQPTQ